MRESWDEFFLKIADVVATRTSCVKRGVGAVLVRDNHIISTGFNGVPRGAPHRTEETCVRIGIPSGQQAEVVCCTHAEVNSIAIAAYHGIATKGATLYCTTQPCAACARVIINAGVVRVLYRNGYPDPTAAQVWEESSVEVSQFGQAPAGTADPSCDKCDADQCCKA